MTASLGFIRWSQGIIRQSAKGHWFLAVCGALGLACSLLALPVIPIIVSACLMSPKRWRAIAISMALGCAIGATFLVILFHFFGWAMIYKFTPMLTSHPMWQEVTQWISHYGGWGLLAIATSPLPEMPALVVFGISKPEIPVVFTAILAGKAIKYGLIAWMACHFPGRFSLGFGKLRAWLGRGW